MMKKNRADIYLDSKSGELVETVLGAIGMGRAYDGVIGPAKYKFAESADGGRTLALHFRPEYSVGGGITIESENALREICTQAAVTWGINPKDMSLNGRAVGLDFEKVRGQVALDLDMNREVA